MVSTSFLAAAVLAALASRFDLAHAVKGTSQMTGGNISGGTCMFTNYTLPAGIYGSTMAGANWDSGLLCGACLNVQSKKGSAVVMVRTCSYIVPPYRNLILRFTPHVTNRRTMARNS